MHKELVEKAKCLKMEMDNKGIDNLTKDDLEEAYYYSKILKNLMCIEKDGQIVEAMEKSENEDNMRAIERYEDYPERRFYDDDLMDKRYYDHYRYENGRFAPKGRGTYRRGYEEMPYYHMTPDMYRDMDRDTMNRMYYTETGMNNGGMNNSRMNESNYDRAKRNYSETKEMHNSNTPQDKEAKMRELEKYMKELSTDITELMSGMSQEEMNMAKSKLTTLVSKM